MVTEMDPDFTRSHAGMNTVLKVHYHSAVWHSIVAAVYGMNLDL